MIAQQPKKEPAREIVNFAKQPSMRHHVATEATTGSSSSPLIVVVLFTNNFIIKSIRSVRQKSKFYRRAVLKFVYTMRNQCTKLNRKRQVTRLAAKSLPRNC